MVFPGGAWEEASPESQGIDPTRFAEAIKYLRGKAPRDGLAELVVIRNGRMIWQGENIDKVHGTWSCTKSFTSTALGLLIDDGKCCLETRAAEFVPELSETYSQVTLRDLTTMTSGYRAVGDEATGGYRHGPSPTPFIPAPEPLFTPPGSQYAYWDSAMNVFALALTKIAGESLEDLFRRRIAEPILMDPAGWDWGDFTTIDGIVVNGGAGNYDKSIHISARQMARFGHLFLNEGTWDGRTLLSAAWVRAASSVEVPASLPWAHPFSELDGRGDYGFNWWVNGRNAQVPRKWAGAPAGTYAAFGANNNFCFVIPEWQMVVVRLGLDGSDGKIGDAIWGEFFERLGGGLPIPR
jgi:CubicO group peptidase (beta-lactamase class C family)